MRRAIAVSLCLLVLTAAGGSAVAKYNTGAEGVMGAGASWWRHGNTHGTLYFVDVYDSAGTYGNKPRSYRAWYGEIPCDVGRRDRPVDCNWRKASYHRVKVDSFEIDPLLNTAHVTLHYGDKRGEVTWTGHGDYSDPFFWQSFGEQFAPPYFSHVYASVMAYTGRDAGARGDLFGLDLKRSEFRDAGMADIVYASAGACLSGPFCW
jgi:hypothetical protein